MSTSNQRPAQARTGSAKKSSQPRRTAAERERILQQWDRFQSSHPSAPTAREFSRRVGVPWSTFNRWLMARDDSQTGEYLDELITATDSPALSREEAEKKLAELLMRQATHLASQIEWELDAKAASDLANAVSKLVEKYQILTGGVTKREESVSSAISDAELDRFLENEST